VEREPAFPISRATDLTIKNGEKIETERVVENISIDGTWHTDKFCWKAESGIMDMEENN
jgi:hypothetical protein